MRARVPISENGVPDRPARRCRVARAPMRTLCLALLTILVAACGVGLPAAMKAQVPAATEAPVSAGRTPVPTIPKAKGDACVAPTDWMRRNHMTVLTHSRAETIQQGAPLPRFSLQGCVTCHAAPDTDGRPVSSADPRHFCRACHDYVAVKIGCFDCHASQPPTPGKATDAGAAGRDVAALKAYLAGSRP